MRFSSISCFCLASIRAKSEVAGAALGQVELLDALIVVADQREVFGARLMQADDVSAKAPDLCDLVPDVRVPPALLGQFVQLAFGLLGLARSINRSICIWRTG